MTESDKSKELQELLEETTSALGGTNNSYSELLKFLQKDGKLSTPNRLMLGQMVFFKYDPTNESFLNSNKYYDVFPLIFVTEVHRGGFEGINVHFLDIKRREFLFEQMLAGLPLNKNKDEWRNRLTLNYQRLKANKKLRYFAPCYRRYRWAGIRKRPVVIPYEYWKVLVEQELAFFMHGKRPSVYRQSLKVIRKSRP